MAIGEIKVLKARHMLLEQSLDEKHAQNRKDIHAVRNVMQEVVNTIHGMQLASAKSKGYWLGIGAAVSFALEIVKIAVEHFVK